jgi:glycosyltransferase involved in cell wall biosynthesis
MQFPVVSEAFAGVEVRALRDQGVDVAVHALRGRAKGAAALLRAWRLNGLSVGYQRVPAALWATVCFAVRQPGKFLQTLAWMLAHGYRKPVLLVKCLAFLPRIFEIFRQAQQQQPDVVHLFWGHYPAVLGRLLQKWLPRTLVSMSLGAYDLVYGFPLSTPVANEADCLWTHAAFNLEALRRVGIDMNRCRVLIRGVDLAQVPRDCLPKSGAKIVSAGRFVAGKGMAEVIEAFAAVAPEFPGATLVLLGDGPERAALQSQVRSHRLEDRIVFRGNVPHDQVYAELRDASVFMLLSSWVSERIPNVVKEAMACGCVCIVADCPGIMEIMSCLEEPLIVKDANPATAAAMLRRVLTAEPLFADDRRRAIEFCRSHLDASKVAQTRLTAWQSALQAKQSRRR